MRGVAKEDIRQECTQGKGIATCLTAAGQGTCQTITTRLDGVCR